MKYFLIFSTVLVNILFYFNLKKISETINIFDKPTSKRKIHTVPVPPIGGTIFFGIFLIYVGLLYFFEFQYSIINFESTKELVSLILGATFFFLVGTIDDKVELSSKIKSILIIVFLFFFLLLDSDLIILEFESYTGKKYFTLNKEFGIYFTIFSIFVFMNAFNMFDGINLQSGLYLLILSIFFIIFRVESFLFISFSICVIFFLKHNYNNEIFLGNSGTLFLGYVISFFLIKLNNSENTIYIEQIFIIMMIPGLDLIRLFILRLLKNNNPFEADNNHIHHILLKRFDSTKVSILIFLITFIPFLISIKFKIFIWLMVLQILTYIFIIKNYSKTK